VKFDEIGIRVKQLREKYLPGISLHRASMMALITYTQLDNIEKGHDFQMRTLCQIAEGWGIPIEEFFKAKALEVGKGEPKEPPKAVVRRKGPSGAQNKLSRLPGSLPSSTTDRTKANP
jgi:hypothetical protein